MHFLNIIAFCTTVLLMISPFFGETKKLVVKVSQHQPCSRVKANAIVLPDYRQAPVRSDWSHPGRYKMSGKVRINQVIDGPIFVYAEIRNDSRADPVPCSNARNGCGGIGSCVYCDICRNTRDRRSLNIELAFDEDPLDCRTVLKPGAHKTVTLSFEAPELEDFLDSQHIDRRFWNEAVGRTGTTIFLTVYIFNEDISRLSPYEIRQRSNSLQRVIGCHKMVLNLSSE